MIKNIFLPEQIRNYYIFGKYVVSLDIRKTHINVTRLYIHGTKMQVESSFEEPIESGIATTLDERTIVALQNIKTRLLKFDELYCTIASNVAIFKELKLPFTSPEKIKMIVDFEVEPLLPFKISDAVVDFIITKEHIEEKSSEILVAAVQKQHVEQMLSLLSQAGFSPSKISIDLFSLYGLYSMIPEYIQSKTSVGIIDLDTSSTRIAHIYNGQLHAIRTLNKGIGSIVKTVSEKLNQPKNQLMDYLIRFGISENNQEEYAHAFDEELALFWQEVNFTLSSFAAENDAQSIPADIIILGSGADIKGLTLFVEKTINTKCHLFSINSLIETKKIVVKNSLLISSSNIISLSNALPNKVTESFNLLQGEFDRSDSWLTIKQLGVAAALALIATGFMLTFTIMQINVLKSEIKESEQEALMALHKEFKKISPEDDNLEDAITIAKEEVASAEKTWFAFSSQARASFLKYLLELTNRIDKESLGFSVDEITMTSNTMLLKAEVKDHEALKIFEQELRKSPLFKYVEPQANPAFSMKISLAPNGQEN